MDPIPEKSYLKDNPGLLDTVKTMHRTSDPDLETVLHMRPALRCYCRLLDGDSMAPNDLLFLTRYGDPDASFILALHFLEENPDKSAILLYQPAKQGYGRAYDLLVELADRGYTMAKMNLDKLTQKSIPQSDKV